MAFRTLCSILSTMWSPVESARAFVPYEFELESSLMYDFGVDPTAPTRCCCSGPSRHECRLMDRENIVPDNFNFWCPQGTALAGAFEQDYSINLTDTCRRERRRVNVTVKAYWVRHGLSCANALQAHPGYRVGKFMLYRDPKLTSLGIHRARALGELIRTKILNSTRRNQVLPSSKPLVFSSAMSRAVETALWNFPEWDVRPIPYIAENGITLDNIPLSTWNTQKEQMLVPPMTERKLQRVVFDDEGTKSHPSRSGLQKKSSYDSFRRYLPGLLDDILEDVEFGREKEPEIPVIIVSHGHYIRHNQKCALGRRLLNNEVWVQEYKVELGADNAILEPTECTTLELPGAPANTQVFPAPPAHFCASDVARCEDGFRANIPPDSSESCSGEFASILARDLHAQEAYTQMLGEAKMKSILSEFS
eukprot:TRINITY_DN5903_c0_g3_i1.p1 TRINITY_DN5903_c0_g3~~TRINITY_DN5903_c0_g3_i1.p1  ORF type:complete len:442 (+),score=42.37 TRINITY_DN5903_c0_g3_i1:64-1326(+)